MKIRTLFLTESTQFKPDPKTLKMMMVHYNHDDTVPASLEAKLGPAPTPEKFLEVFTSDVLDRANQYMGSTVDEANKFYPWLARQYALGTVEIENILARAGETMWGHKVISQRNVIDDKFKDLNAFPNYKALEKFVNKYSAEIRAAKEAEKIKHLEKDAKYFELLNDDSVRAVIPLNKEAAIVLARRAGGCFANWCTGTIVNNYFAHYSSDGPLVVILYNSAPCDKVQFHVESGQFMDKADNRVPLEAWGKKNPGLMAKIQAAVSDAAPTLSEIWPNLSTWPARVKQRFGEAFVEAQPKEQEPASNG